VTYTKEDGKEVALGDQNGFYEPNQPSEGKLITNHDKVFKICKTMWDGTTFEQEGYKKHPV